MGRVWHVDEGPSHERSYSKSEHTLPSHFDPLPLFVSVHFDALVLVWGLHIFAMTQSQQKQGSSLLCPAANDSACSHTQRMVTTASWALLIHRGKGDT